MLEKLKVSDFDAVYRLMELSFPDDEYRPYAEQKELLSRAEYSIYTQRDDEREIMGFIALWDFEGFAFIEHFAVNPEYRNGGIGAKMLGELMGALDKPLCLELEPPDTEIARRRIGFYERNGLFFNDYPYMQPAISQGKNALPLYIMTSGGPVDEAAFLRIKTTLYTHVYRQVTR